MVVTAEFNSIPKMEKVILHFLIFADIGKSGKSRTVDLFIFKRIKKGDIKWNQMKASMEVICAIILE